VESPERESTTSTVTRSQHVLYVLPPNRDTITKFMAPVVARVNRDAAEPQVLVVTPDEDMALAVVAMSNPGENPVSVLPVAGSRRAQRLLRARPPQLVAGPVDSLLELVRSSALKLDSVRSIVVAWADHIYTVGDGAALDTLFGELPKEVARVVVAEVMTPEVKGLVERQLRRPRREEPEAVEGLALPVSVVVAAGDARRRALRRLFETLDPPSALVVPSSDRAAEEANQLTSALGHSNDEAVVVSADSSIGAGRSLTVLYGLPQSVEVLQKLADSGTGRVIAIVEPREVAALRRMAGAELTPFVFPDSGAAARQKEQKLRDQIREELAKGTPAREILTLEPLFAEFDGSEVAAVLLKMLEHARSVTPAPVKETASGAGKPESGFSRVFLTVGSRDNVAPGDLVGAISGESGIRSSQIGRIDIRESFSLVEIAEGDAEKVIGAMNGATIRGRKVAARADREPGGREGSPPRSRERSGSRGDARGGRGAPRPSQRRSRPPG
jgi:ATP-dependent RNA helicase DeaD